jgi:hypothetical protein
MVQDNGERYFLTCCSICLCIPIVIPSTSYSLADYAVAQEQSFNQTEIVVAQTPEEKANLERFDFEAWNNRNWTLFREIRAPDVLVVDFNGNETKGIEQHVQWAMAEPEKSVPGTGRSLFRRPVLIPLLLFYLHHVISELTRYYQKPFKIG